jgi:pimeloyl-ACP methyl ester carboxylesterase
MSSAWGASIDRSLVPAMELMWMLGGNPNDESRQARQARSFDFYTSPRWQRESFFVEPPTPRIERRRSPLERRIERLRWPSNYRTRDPDYQARFDRWEANGTCHAEHFRHPRGCRGTVILVHSWATGNFLFTREAFQLRDLYRSGLDVFIFILPFHGPRTPKGSLYGGQLFPGTSPRRTNETFGQAIWDLRGLIKTIEGPVGVMGQSLGGYVAALLASVEPRLSFVIPMVPMVSLADLMWELGERNPQRRAAEERGVTVDTLRDLYAVHSPLRLEPLVPRHRRMIIAGSGDRVTRPDHVELLWQHWDRPRIHWFPGGHMLHFGRGAAFAEAREFLADI